MLFNQYLKIFIIFILFFFSLTYFFVPIYELLCSKFGWGINFDTKIFNKFLYNINLNSSKSISINDSLYIKNILKKNFLYRKNIHYDYLGHELLIPIYFQTTVHGKLPLLFFINENLVQVKIDSSQLVIFNIYNYSNFNIDFFIGYQIFPYSLTEYIIKLQCFCYEHILILKNSFLKLPVLFFIDKDIIKFFNSYLDNYFSCIYFYYHIYKSSNFIDLYLGKNF
jgi:cytochrome c oxidase assembly protein subunit 11